MIEAIAQLMGTILLFIYNNFGKNYGIAIILLTLLVRAVTLPLTHKQMASAKAMQDLQPELKKLQEKYKNDKEKLNAETMELWKKHNINPAAGCLPLIIQFPILVAIFRLLQYPEKLQGIENFVVLGIDMTKSLATVFGNVPFNQTLGYVLLVLLSGATTYLQQKMMMTDKSQQSFLVVMPLMILIFSYNFPAGLVLYWVVGNIFSIIHHFIINRPVTKEA